MSSEKKDVIFERQSVSLPSSLATADGIKEIIIKKISDGPAANPDLKLLFELLIDPKNKEYVDFIKSHIDKLISGNQNSAIQSYLMWLGNNYDKISPELTPSSFINKTVDLYVQNEDLLPVSIVINSLEEKTRIANKYIKTKIEEIIKLRQADTEKYKNDGSYIKKYLDSKFQIGIDYKNLQAKIKTNRKEKLISNLPDVAPHWINRTNLQAEFFSKISQNPYIAITGIAGSGKTQFAHYSIFELKEKFKEKNLIIIREFILDHEGSLENAYREFIKALKLEYIDEISIEKLKEKELFQVIKDGLDLLYPESAIIFLYDNVDDEKDRKSVNACLNDNKIWFENRACLVIVTTQKQRFFDINSGLEISLNNGLTLIESLQLLNKAKSSNNWNLSEDHDYAKFLSKLNINLEISAKDFDKILPQLNQDMNICNPGELQYKYLGVISTLELIKLFDALPLALAIAREYMSIRGKDPTAFFNLVKIENIETEKFIDSCGDEYIKDYYKKDSGACSQISAIRLMINSLDKENDFWTSSLKPSQILQVLSFFSNKDIPDFFITKLFEQLTKDHPDFSTDRFIMLLTNLSLVTSKGERYLYRQPKIGKPVLNILSEERNSITLISLHSQTQFAARSMLEEHKRGEKIKDCLNIINNCNQDNDLRYARNLEIKNLIGTHFFNLLNYISNQSFINKNIAYSIHDVLSNYSEIIINYIETNYHSNWPISLLDSNPPSKSGVALTNRLRMMLYENTVDCLAEIHDITSVNYYGELAIKFYKSLRLNNKLQLDNEDILISLSMLRIYLHLKEYREPNKILMDINKYLQTNKSDNKETFKKFRQLLIDTKICSKKLEEAVDLFSSDYYQIPDDDIESVFNDFEKASILLHIDLTEDALNIFDELIVRYKLKPYDIEFIEDIYVAKLICLIKRDRYEDAIKFYKQELKNNKNIQINYLICLAYILSYHNSSARDIAKKSIILNESKIFFETILSEALSTPRDFHLLEAYRYSIEGSNNLAIEKYKDYFEQNERHNPIEKFKSKLARRVFYFLPKSISLLMNDYLIEKLSPYYLYSELLKQEKQHLEACKILMKFIHYDIRKKWSVRTDKTLERIAAIYADSDGTYDDFLTIMGEIEESHRTGLYYFYLGLIDEKQYFKDSIPEKIIFNRIISNFKKSIEVQDELIKSGNKNSYDFRPHIRLVVIDIKQKNYIEAKAKLDSICSKFFNSEIKVYNKTESRIIKLYNDIIKGLKADYIITPSYQDKIIECCNEIINLDAENQGAYYEKIKIYTLKKSCDILFFEEAWALCAKSDASIDLNLRDELINLIKAVAENKKNKDRNNLIYFLMKQHENFPDDRFFIYEILDYYIEFYNNISLPKMLLYCKSLIEKLEKLSIYPNKEEIKNESEKNLKYARFFEAKGSHELASIMAGISFKINRNNLQARILFIRYQIDLYNDSSSLIDAARLLGEIESIKDEHAKISKLYAKIASKLVDINVNLHANDIEKYYEKAIKYDENNKNANELFGAYLKRKGDKKAIVDKLRIDYEKSISLISIGESPFANDFANSLIDYSATLADDDANKINVIKEAIQVKPNLCMPYIKLAESYYRLKEYTKANENIEIAFKLHDTVLKDCILRGLCKLRLGLYDKAIENYYPLIKSSDNDLHNHAVFFSSLALILKTYDVTCFDNTNSEEQKNAIVIATHQFKNLSKIKKIDTIENISKQDCKFFWLYSKYLYLIIQLLHNNNLNIQNDINELKEDLIGNGMIAFDENLLISNHMSSSGSLPKSIKNNKMKFKLKELFNEIVVVEKYLRNKSDIPNIILANLIGNQIYKAVTKYNKNISYNQSGHSARFLSCWELCRRNNLEDLFSVEKVNKYKLLLQWFQSISKSDSKLYTYIKQDVSQSFFDASGKYPINNNEKYIDEAIGEYEKESSLIYNNSSKFSKKFIEDFYEIKFTIPESEKEGKYKKLLDDYMLNTDTDSKRLRDKLEKKIPLLQTTIIGSNVNFFLDPHKNTLNDYIQPENFDYSQVKDDNTRKLL